MYDNTGHRCVHRFSKAVFSVYEMSGKNMLFCQAGSVSNAVSMIPCVFMTVTVRCPRSDRMGMECIREGWKTKSVDAGLFGRLVFLNGEFVYYRLFFFSHRAGMFLDRAFAETIDCFFTAGRLDKLSSFLFERFLSGR